MPSKLDQIDQAAARDAETLSKTFDTIPFKDWDAQAAAAWCKVAGELGLDSGLITLRQLYTKRLIARCSQLNGIV